MCNLRSVLLLLAMVLSLSCAFAQSNIRGLYVNKAITWLGDSAKEEQLLNYARANQYNYLAIYGLHAFSWTSAGQNKVAAFIRKAKVQYGISQIGATSETYSFHATKVVPYNNGRTDPNEKFDVLNFEFEFWIKSRINTVYASQYLIPNGYTPDTAGAFAYSHSVFKRIDSLCAANGLISEIYLGWPNRGQMQQIVAVADRILLHAYRKTDADVYQYSRNRLNDMASAHVQCHVLPIFSSEPDFMANYLATNSFTKPYQVYSNYFQSDTGDIKQYLKLDGFQWFIYSYMPNPYLNNSNITASGSLSLCPGGSVTLTASPGQSYLWMPGQQTTQSITVSTPGNYSVVVTNAMGLTATSAPVTVSVTTSALVPMITSSAPLKLCQGNSLTLTASQADTYQWSNGSTNRSITVSTAGSYSVAATAGGCSGTSAVTQVEVVPPPASPAVTASGSLSICPGTAVTLTSEPAGGYLWSNGMTTRSIIVGSAGTYTVRAYSAPYCFSTSAVQSITQLPAPPVPVITPPGPLTLTSTSPTLTLTSTTASAYSWNTGSSKQSILVRSQGSYRVTVTGANGCKATSSAVQVSANGCTPPPVPVITASGPTTIIIGQSVTLTSSPASGYRWSTGQTTQSITVDSPGVYNVRNYDGGYCFSTSLDVTVRVIYARKSNPISAEEEKANVEPSSLYPNPARGSVSFRFFGDDNGKRLIRIVDLTGRVVQSVVHECVQGLNVLTLDISGLKAGVYYYTVSGKESEDRFRLVVE